MNDNPNLKQKEQYMVTINNMNNYDGVKQFAFTMNMTPQEYIRFCDRILGIVENGPLDLPNL